MVQLLRGMVVGGAAVFIGASATMNAVFLSSLGRTGREALLYGTVSVAADVVKAALPVVVVRAVAVRAWGHGAAAGALLVVIIVMSLASGAGYAALTRGAVTASRENRAQALQQAETDLAGTEARLQAVATARSLAVIAAELKAQELDRRWQTSLGCADGANASVRAFCMEVQKLRIEREQAAEASRLRQERDGLRARISALRDGGAGESSDPQAAALAALLGADQQALRTGFNITLAVLLELGSVVLVMLAAGPALRAPSPPETRAPSEPCRDITPATVPLQSDRSYWRRQRDKSIMAPDAAVSGRGPHHGT